MSISMFGSEVRPRVDTIHLSESTLTWADTERHLHASCISFHALLLATRRLPSVDKRFPGIPHLFVLCLSLYTLTAISLL